MYAHKPLDVNLDACFVGVAGGLVVLWTQELGQKTLLVLDKSDLSDAGVWVDSHDGMHSFISYLLWLILSMCAMTNFILVSQ